MMMMSDQEFSQLAQFIESKTGIHLKAEKRALLSGRLQRLVQEKGLSSFSEYYHLLRSVNGARELTMLVNKISTNHTFFMREKEHFQYFQHQVLPELTRRSRERDLRIWCAGCSSGEEPYTLSMIIEEYFSGGKQGWDTQLLATDISCAALDTARSGRYCADDIAVLPDLWKKRYFEPSSEGGYAVRDHVRSQVLFRKFNLMEERFPFKQRFQVIFCRNVMIYFDQATRYKLVRKFYELTEPGGYLFIGQSESLERGQTDYRYVLPSVYRK